MKIRPHTLQRRQSLQHSHIAQRNFCDCRSKPEAMLLYNPEILIIIWQNFDTPQIQLKIKDIMLSVVLEGNINQQDYNKNLIVKIAQNQPTMFDKFDWKNCPRPPKPNYDHP